MVNINPIIFLRTAWMINYEGVTKLDKPNGAGSYVKENQDGGEVVNFLPVGSKVYGYARIRKGNDLRIQRLGATNKENYLDNVTIVFFATDPIFGGQFVIGWYDNARLYRSLQSLKNGMRGGYPEYMAVTNKSNATLLAVNNRTLIIPDDGPGQTNAWYVSEYSKAKTFLNKFFEFKLDPSGYKKGKSVNNKGGSGWQLDAEKRKKIEIAAMDATYAYFQAKGFEIKYVHLDKVGWDMEAVKGKTILLLEVKGSSNALDAILLTPNEYANSKLKANYRVCILENALNADTSRLHICKISADSKYWISELGEKLKVNEVISAQLKKIDL